MLEHVLEEDGVHRVAPFAIVLLSFGIYILSAAVLYGQRRRTIIDYYWRDKVSVEQRAGSDVSIGESRVRSW